MSNVNLKDQSGNILNVCLDQDYYDPIYISDYGNDSNIVITDKNGAIINPKVNGVVGIIKNNKVWVVYSISAFGKMEDMLVFKSRHDAEIYIVESESDIDHYEIIGRSVF